MLQRAKEIVYKTLSLHPASATDMRKYYLSVLSRNFEVSWRVSMQFLCNFSSLRIFTLFSYRILIHAVFGKM